MSNRNSRNPAEQIDANRAIAVAESMKKDFLSLIALVDGVAEARTAAERGLRLSEELVELLRGAAREASFEEVESPPGFRR